jgi:GtrA-like protein.
LLPSKSHISIAFLYTAFALLSSAINIGSQMIFLLAYNGPYDIELSILFGTAMGMPPRYVLEKRYVFKFKAPDFKTDSRNFLVYGLIGALITPLFWITEYAFHLIFLTDTMRYVGGIIGLAIGFYVKYQLDKKYVFISGDKKVVV